MAPTKSKKKKRIKPKNSGKVSKLKKNVLAKRAAPKKKAARRKGRVRGKSQIVATLEFEPKGLGASSGGQSGDLQGLSNVSGADSESVDELLEEGNAFEAEVVEGVQNARDADQGEVRTHEVPEDDVPEEYSDEDK